MSQDKTKTSKVNKVFSGIHRRMSSFGKSAHSPQSPQEPSSLIADDHSVSQSQSSSLFTSVISTNLQQDDQRDTRLFSLSKLIGDASINEKDKLWFEKINIAVRALMNSSDYDTSYDYEHIQRVVMNAHHLWHAENYRDEFRNVNALVVFVAAMVHDVADDKYLSDEAVRMETYNTKREMQRNAIEAFIKKAAPECPPYIWGPASHIASLVSFTRELRDPGFVAEQCIAYPALQIVQDADRLDGLGALGVVRAAMYGSFHQPRGTGTLRRVVHVIDHRLCKYPEINL